MGARQFGEDADLDCGQRLPAHRDPQKRLGLRADLYRILQVASLTLFEKTPLLTSS